jgi:hypothetical protein
LFVANAAAPEPETALDQSAWTDTEVRPKNCFLSPAALLSDCIGGCRAHPMGKLHYERADYSVVVKNRAPPPKAWRWEIYRVGNANPIKQSSIYFDTTAAARRAGKNALKDQLIARHR